MLITNRQALSDGIRDGIPIGLGYFVVSFTLGITAKHAGLNPLQGFFASLFNNASAGEYAGFTVIMNDAPYLEIAVITLVANARYLLMSTVMSQKFSPDTPFKFFSQDFFSSSVNFAGFSVKIFCQLLNKSSLSLPI